MARRWAEMAWPELTDLSGEVALVPVGATEQHGPHLPTGTDTIIATALCDRVSERTSAPLLPAIPVAASYGHGTELPGTVSLTPELLAQVARQYVEWAAAATHVTRLLFINAHFGNSASLSIATDNLRLYRPDLQVGVVDWWNLDPVISAEMTSDGSDVHANRSETSVMLAIAPELVHLERLSGADDADRTGSLVFRYTAPALSSNGVTGQPSLASTELGVQLVERSVERISDLVRRGRTEEPPMGRSPLPHLHRGVDTWTH